MSLYEEAIQKEISLNPHAGTLEYYERKIAAEGFHNCQQCGSFHNGNESGRIGLLRLYLDEVVKQRDALLTRPVDWISRSAAQQHLREVDNPYLSGQWAGDWAASELDGVGPA